MPIGLRQACDVADLRKADALELFAQWFGVIDHVMGAEFGDPGLGFRARSRTNDGQAGQLTRQLSHD